MSPRERLCATTRRAGLLVCALAGLWSCADCGRSARSAEELLPGAFAVAGVTAPLGQLSLALEREAKALSTTALAEPINGVVVAMARELGFDLLKREGLLSAGLDPERGAAFVIPPAQGAQRTPWMAALPLAKPDLFLQKVDALLQRRGLFPQREEEARAGLKIVVYSRPGDQQKVGFGVVRGHGLVARAADPVAELVAAQGRPVELSLAKNPQLARARADQGARDVIVILSEGTELLRRFATIGAPGETSVGLLLKEPLGEAGADGFSARIVQRLTESAAKALHEALPGGQDLLGFLPKAPLMLQLSVRTEKLPELLKATRLAPLVEGLEASLKAQGLELDKGVFASLGSEVALAVRLSPTANLARATDPAVFELTGGGFLDVIEVTALGAVVEPKKLEAVLDAALDGQGRGRQARFEELGLVVKKGPSTLGEGFEWTVTDQRGHEARLGVVASPSRASGAAAIGYLLSGKGDPKEILAAVLKPPAQATAPAAAAVRVDLAELWTQVQRLPPEAYGSGPGAMVARSLTTQVLEPLSRLKGKVELRIVLDRLSVDAAVSLAGPKAGAPKP